MIRIRDFQRQLDINLWLIDNISTEELMKRIEVLSKENWRGTYSSAEVSFNPLELLHPDITIGPVKPRMG